MRKKVFIADGDKETLVYFKKLLTAHGYEVLAASDDRELLEKCENFEPHVVLLDTQLGGTDGFRLCQKIKSDHRIKDCIVVLMSNINQEEMWKEHFYEFGASSLLQKPINSQILLTIIESHFPLPQTTVEYDY
ncbi:MAG: response regulator [Deltaproteobacteria bacterium]|nr:response regulator [Deltaproteobacteria bacterium]